MDTKSAALEFFIKYVAPILGAATMAVGTWALKKVGDYFNAHAKESKLMAIGAQVTTVAQVAVHNMEPLKQEYAAASADGVITAEEGEKLKKLAMEQIKLSLGTAGLTALKNSMGIGAEALPSFLSGLVEKTVAGLPDSSPKLADPKVGATLAVSAPTGKAADALPFANLPGGLPPP